MFKNIFPFFNKNKITEMTNNSEEQQTSSSTEETIIEVVIQPPTPEAKVECDALPAVITTQPVQPMPEHDDSIAVVMWEATVTGRRLIDEMVNLGSFYMAQGEKAEGHDFNEYVMPYGKLPLNVIRNYNLRIVDTGRYRMLKEIRNNRMLKSKSEVAACNDFASWLIKLQKDNFPDKKIVLVFFEPRHSKILQLFQALERYRLLDDVNKILLGCVNGWDLLRQQVHDLKDEHRMVLKALADHHLGVDTPLESAVQRAQALHKILRKVHGGRINTGVLKENLISCDHLLEQVKKIKEELTKEAQWRPVFADMFRQGIKPRRRAGFLRHMLVESGITYVGLTETFKDKKDDGVVEVIKENIKGKNEADVEEVIKLLNQHLAQPDKPVRRGSGRRAPRTRSLCTATDLEKQQPASKIEPEENNNDPVKVIMDVIPSTPAVLSEV
ncbi:maternal protein exuperantia-like isoform X2 [Daphnia pulex]|uniref:maternal protein exuperantia-like isoform X2 n=1 Tax=Daphnia pulex TaxID=6669 RepID=UPI001EDF0E66|nr:maternal protein exuperantia-like isoform X2 [Daphnia pulex]